MNSYMSSAQMVRLKPISQPLTMFLLGATGNLAKRKILKALYELYIQDLLPEKFQLFAVARSQLSQQEYRDLAKLSVKPEEMSKWDQFEQSIKYISGDLTEFATYERLKAQHQEYADEKGCGNHLWYVATLPSLYVSVAKYIGQAGLNKSSCGWTKLMIEKPFGTDAETAKQLNTFLGSIFKEDQIYRIDHFLAKETVQNLLSFRFGNGLFEHLWNRRYIDNIQVQSTETVGVVGRGEFYEGVGTVRDVVQNHVLQLIAMTMMEEPRGLSAEAINQTRNQFLKNLKVWKDDPVKFSKFGQYMGGEIDGQPVADYATEAGLEHRASVTETAVAAVMEAKNSRWKGVPIYLRAGKRMQQTAVEISVQFKEPQNQLFGRVGQRGNVLTLRIQPNEGVVLRLNAKRPGLTLQADEVPMQFCYQQVFQMGLVEAYVKLLYDAIKGDGLLFPTAEGIELAWKTVAPLLARKRQPDFVLEPYAAGSYGPKSFDELIEKQGRIWLEPSMAVCQI